MLAPFVVFVYGSFGRLETTPHRAPVERGLRTPNSPLSSLVLFDPGRGETPHLKPESCSDVSRLPCSLRGVCLRSDVRSGSFLGYFLVALPEGDVG